MLEKHPQEIDISDVRAFCAQNVPESRWLDYKEAYSSSKGNQQIAKLVSAFANAHGGWVLLGIEEKKDSQNRGVPGALKGIDKSLRLGERIKQICLDAIYPPVVPEIGTCDLDADNEIVIVRVFESDSTPHQTLDGKVYIRTNDISHLSDDGTEARVTDIELLLNKRAKTTALRSSLIERARTRLQINPEVPQLQITIMPTFPDVPICDYDVLTASAEACRAFFAFRSSTKLHTGHEAVFQSFERTSAVEEGGRRTMFEFNVYGMIYYTTVIVSNKAPQGAQYGIQSDVALGMLYSLLQAAEHYYQRTQFSGLVSVSMALQAKGGSAALMTNPALGMTVEPIRDRFFSIDSNILTYRMRDPSFIAEIYRDFLWSAGYGPEIRSSAKPLELVQSLEEDASFGKVVIAGSCNGKG